MPPVFGCPRDQGRMFPGIFLAETMVFTQENHDFAQENHGFTQKNHGFIQESNGFSCFLFIVFVGYVLSKCDLNPVGAL